MGIGEYKTVIRYPEPLKKLDHEVITTLENPIFGKHIPDSTPNHTGATFYSSGGKTVQNSKFII